MQRTPPSWVPDSLLQLGPAGIAWWQWIAIVVVIVAALALGRIVAWVVRWGLGRVVRRTTATWDDQLLARLDRPIRLLAAVGFARAGFPMIELGASTDASVHGALLAVLGLGLLWGAFAVIDVIVAHIASAPWAHARPASRGLLTLGGRIIKVIVVAIGLIGFLGGLGVPVASLLAGLGIGGIALAFGAQKTVENLFGAFAIGVDQPLREGDLVRVDDLVQGTVEAVGLRSTRIRTLDRTVVSLPNGRLSDMRIETFALRDRCRLHTVIGLVYGTTSAQLHSVLAGLEGVLRAHPGIWPGDVIVRFTHFGASALEVHVQAWFQTQDQNVFRLWRQEVLLGFMSVVEEAGTAFAFPTQTLHIASVPAPEPRAR